MEMCVIRFVRRIVFFILKDLLKLLVATVNDAHLWKSIRYPFCAGEEMHCLSSKIVCPDLPKITMALDILLLLWFYFVLGDYSIIHSIDTACNSRRPLLQRASHWYPLTKNPFTAKRSG